MFFFLIPDNLTKLRKILVLAFLGLFVQSLQGCLSVDENIYKVRHEIRKTNPDDIVVLMAKPDRKIIVFGDTSVRYNSGYTRDTALTYLKKSAAMNGADGIILNPIRRVEDKFGISNAKTEDSRNMELETYILSASMFQYLPE